MPAVPMIANVVNDTKDEIALMKLWIIEHSRTHEEQTRR